MIQRIQALPLSIRDRDRLVAEVERLTKEASVIADIVGIDPNEPSDHSVLFECAEHIRSTFESHRKLAHDVVRLSARVRELELTEEDRDVLRVAGDWLMRLHEVPSSDADPALAVLDRLVKGGR